MYNTRRSINGLGDSGSQNDTNISSDGIYVKNSAPPAPDQNLSLVRTIIYDWLLCQPESCRNLVADYINIFGVYKAIEYKSRNYSGPQNFTTERQMAEQQAKKIREVIKATPCAKILDYDHEIMSALSALFVLQSMHNGTSPITSPNESKAIWDGNVEIWREEIMTKKLPPKCKSTIPDTKKDPIVPNQPCPCECKPVSTPRQVYLTPNCTSPNCYAITVRRQKRVCNLPKPTGKNYKFDCNEIARLNLELNK